MSTSTNWTIIQQAATACAQELFAHYGVDLTPLDGEVSTADPCIAVIGYAGDDMRGALAISASQATIRASNVISANPTPAQDRDWTGELSNQLLGRVQNRLLQHGAHIRMGTPLVLTGTSFQIHSPKQAPNMRVAFDSKHGPIEVWFDAEFEPGFELTEAPEEEEAAEEEGAMLWF